jgi:hypothetical protein
MTFRTPWIESIYQIHGVRFTEPLPEGRPVGAVLGDFVVDKSTGELVELYHFSFDDERCCVTESTSYFIFASANSSKGG